MASQLPLPLPPRTPTPPSDDEHNAPKPNRTSPTKVSFDPSALSPRAEDFPINRNSGSHTITPTTPSSIYSATLESTQEDETVNSESGRNPFNFQTTTLARSPVARSNVGQRRGHKYKHSSVSHQIFLEPPPRAPLALPASLPIPTFAECRKSMSREQTRRITWCGCHALVAGHTLYAANGSLAMTALSHLVLYDALGAALCVAVDVLGNFEVWKRSSIKHPFGLERAEVLAGFAMSVFLAFMGMDLISHNVTHILEGMGHEPHHVHNHERVSPGSIDVAVLLAIVSTMVSAIGLRNHARIGKAMRFAYIDALPSVLSNPSHFLTLSCSATLLLLPLLSIEMFIWLDRALSGTYAMCMCILGFRLVKVLGFMLLMSYSGNGVSDVMQEISLDPNITTVEEARFWQVHYGLCMANLKLKVRGTEDSLVRLRERLVALIRNKLGGGYGSGGSKWEVSTQLTLDSD